jgi:hypothetical protein
MAMSNITGTKEEITTSNMVGLSPSRHGNDRR